ncbi:MAG: hypothetical protein SFV15_13530 [Polyangiaceae bacterium]|nr:hypothetical protein [Polyangiaceae bacterium]
MLPELRRSGWLIALLALSCGHSPSNEPRASVDGTGGVGHGVGGGRAGAADLGNGDPRAPTIQVDLGASVTPQPLCELAAGQGAISCESSEPLLSGGGGPHTRLDFCTRAPADGVCVVYQEPPNWLDILAQFTPHSVADIKTSAPQGDDTCCYVARSIYIGR